MAKSGCGHGVSMYSLTEWLSGVDVLEEVMFLINHTSIQLSLLPQENSSKLVVALHISLISSPLTFHRSRTVTRGVNSRAKEELVSAVEQQLERCEEPLELILKTFFKQEKLCFTAAPST